jgi:hypothetical protein
MPMQRGNITLTADDHGGDRAAAERPPLPVDPARAARDADGTASKLVALLRSGPDPGMAAAGRCTVRDACGAELYAQLAHGTPAPAPAIEAITALNDQIVADLGDQDLPTRAGRIEANTEADAAASLAAIGRDAIGFAGRPVLWPLLIGAWKRKEQP